MLYFTDMSFNTHTGLIIGNLFSLLSAICLAVSAMKKSKKKMMLWQSCDAAFGILANAFLCAYAAMVISLICFIRNVLSYRDKMNKTATCVFLLLGVVAGACANNLGAVGWLPITAAAVYTVCIWLTVNEQQMRYALIVNLLLWFAHCVFVKAVPSAVVTLTLCLWTAIQAVKKRK